MSEPIPIKEEFPLLSTQDIVYLDSAATTQKPQIVINTITNHYMTNNANAHRSVYPLAAKATHILEDARQRIAKFINAQVDEIIFTKNTTESINLLAQSISPQSVATTIYEHHSNFLPWKAVATEVSVCLTEDELLRTDAQVITVTGKSNVTGWQPDLTRIRAGHKGILIVDACQLIAHQRVDVKAIDCDALVFSAHKIYGPLGVGVLYIKKELQQDMPPFLLGGGMVASVEAGTWSQGPQKFEAGTQDIAGIAATATAVAFIERQYEHIHMVDETLTPQLISILESHAAHIMSEGGGIISFTIPNVHAFDVATLLGEKGICVRSGNHCAQPLMRHLGVEHTLRISLGAYNTKQDVERFAAAMKEVMTMVKR